MAGHSLGRQIADGLPCRPRRMRHCGFKSERRCRAEQGGRTVQGRCRADLDQARLWRSRCGHSLGHCSAIVVFCQERLGGHRRAHTRRWPADSSLDGCASATKHARLCGRGCTQARAYMPTDSMLLGWTCLCLKYAQTFAATLRPAARHSLSLYFATTSIAPCMQCATQNCTTYITCLRLRTPSRDRVLSALPPRGRQVCSSAQRQRPHSASNPAKTELRHRQHRAPARVCDHLATRISWCLPGQSLTEQLGQLQR